MNIAGRLFRFLSDPFGDVTGHAVPTGFIETRCSNGMHRLLRFATSLHSGIKIQKSRNFVKNHSIIRVYGCLFGNGIIFRF